MLSIAVRPDNVFLTGATVAITDLLPPLASFGVLVHSSTAFDIAFIAREVLAAPAAASSVCCERPSEYIVARCAPGVHDHARAAVAVAQRVHSLTAGDLQFVRSVSQELEAVIRALLDPGPSQRRLTCQTRGRGDASHILRAATAVAPSGRLAAGLEASGILSELSADLGATLGVPLPAIRRCCGCARVC